MSPKLPRITADDLLRALRRAGWRPYRQKGSHLSLVHPTRVGTVTVPVHVGRILKPGTLQGALEQAGMSVDELIELL